MSELPANLRRLIESGQPGLGPSAEDKERTRHRILAATGLAAAAPPLGAAAEPGLAGSACVTSAGARPGGGLTLAKVSLGIIASVAVVVGGLVGLTSRGENARSTKEAEQTAAGQTELSAASEHASPAFASASESGPDETTAGHEPSLPDMVVAQAPEAESTDEEPAVDAERSIPRVTHAGSHKQLPRRRGAEARPEHATSPEAPGWTGEVPPRPQVPTPLDDGDDLRHEMQLLAQVRRASDHCEMRRALSLLDRYGLQHPEGQLATEADYLRIVVLCRAGKEAQARKRSQQFRERWPSSPLGAQVDGTCNLHETKDNCDEEE